MYLTWLDSDSWLIELGEHRILLDPWLVGSLTFANLGWLLRGDRAKPHPIPEAIDLILLSQGVADHTHVPTLQQLDRQTPVVASPSAAKVVRRLGYHQVIELAHGQSFVLANRVKIEAVPGAPIGPLSVENGYLVTDLAKRQTLYYEPHGAASPQLKGVTDVDVVITPMLDLEVPLAGQLINGRKAALILAQWFKPQVMVQTGAEGEVTFDGLLAPLLQRKGSVDEVRRSLAQYNLPTQVLEPKLGDRLELTL